MCTFKSKLIIYLAGARYVFKVHKFWFYLVDTGPVYLQGNIVFVI